MNKTLIGKNGYLYLQNDSGRELEIHNNNMCNVPDDFYIKYETHKHKYLLTVFPDKSHIYNKYLPDGYNCIHRPAFEKYKTYLKTHMLDGYEILSKHNIDELPVYYKTDTHINLYGSYLVYMQFVNKINELFGLERAGDAVIASFGERLNSVVPVGSRRSLTVTPEIIDIQRLQNVILMDMGVGIGDLTAEINLGDQVLDNIDDDYFYTTDFEGIYTKYCISEEDVSSKNGLKLFKYTVESVLDNVKKYNTLIDDTHNHVGKIVDWDIISSSILYKNNKNDSNFANKVVIFYDSFLLSMLPIYISMFDEVYLCKMLYNNDIIDLIEPDYIFEFRVERFLF